MYYNLEKYGEKVSTIRKSLSLTREQLYDLSYVSVETIRKIETGKYHPSYEILDSLSHVLKVDLNRLILDYRLDNFEEFNIIRNNMESKFDRDEYYTLESEYNDFANLLKSTKNQYYQKLISQLMLLINSVILDKKEKKPKESLDKLIEAMQVSTPGFLLSNYKAFVYNDVEIRILMNIAMLTEELKSYVDAANMMEFCMRIVNTNNEIYPKLCHNLSSIYSLLDDYKNSLKYSNLGIEYCNENRNFNGLNLLYFSKGVAEYSLGHEGYIESLNKSISFCDIMGQDELKKVIINKCRKFYNIELT
ncbi:helix-turn-helix transcriptional regulator [Tissierella sp.]|uniref:helix-turn-helix domain-containing protein n=1 Tax=Tissierella sp. TaxID=41274 RepID=UPI002858FC1D|nr:helix-turn-helix transcriptional regulator [Tissierella sp.]MDR7855078.1 helix-turn-helix transcriptional regulator [Tissierella sp.]